VDVRRLRVGEWITALAGVVLLVSLFLPWYGAADAVAATEVSGWEALALLDIVLALIAAAAVALAVITAAQRLPAVPLTLNTFVVWAGMLAVVVVLVRVIDLPDGAGAREWGLWLGLAGALGILVGGLIALRDDRRVSPDRYTDLSGRPAPAPRELEAIPAPRPDLQSPR
jgi:phosphatidylglycerophosphate synthase